MRRLVLLALVSAAASGCSTVGSTFGFTPPQHPLLPEAKAFRSLTPAPDGPRELTKQLHPAYVVEPGDVLLVQAAELDAAVRIPADQPVLPDGTINLGKYGRPVVAGKTVPEIEAQVQQLVAAAETEKLTIGVRLINRVSKVFYVLGEVNAPGSFALVGRETVLDAIVQAGGLTRRANENLIVISRPTEPCGGRVVLPVCYPQIVQLGDTTTNYQIQAGDRVFVPSRGFTDDLFGHRKTCPPCDAPQTLAEMIRTPCPSAGCPTDTCGPRLLRR